MGGMGVCLLGMVFGLMIYMQLQRMPVHKAMLEISELIYETCKTYLITQIKFILGARAAHRRHHGRVLRRAQARRAGQGGADPGL